VADPPPDRGPCCRWLSAFSPLKPGKRTTGTGAKDFVVTGPGYTGELPADIPVIAAPTPYVWIVGRTQTNGPDGPGGL
jgi:hypothetical protein